MIKVTRAKVHGSPSRLSTATARLAGARSEIAILSFDLRYSEAGRPIALGRTGRLPSTASPTAFVARQRPAGRTTHSV